MNNEKKFDKWFNVFILGGMTLVMIVTTAIQLARDDSDAAMLLVAAFGSLMGVLSTVCSANARILTFLFGFFDVTIYGVMCFLSHNYGNGALHLAYFLPMQFIGFWQWRRRGASSGTGVRARRLTARQRILWGFVFLAGLAATYFVLVNVGEREAASVVKTAIFMDAFSTICNIIGQLLMSTAYMEQWFFWIGVNVASVAMWTATASASSGSDDYAFIYVVKYSFYLLNSLNGLRIWLKLSRSES